MVLLALFAVVALLGAGFGGHAYAGMYETPNSNLAPLHNLAVDARSVYDKSPDFTQNKVENLARAVEETGDSRSESRLVSALDSIKGEEGLLRASIAVKKHLTVLQEIALRHQDSKGLQLALQLAEQISLNKSIQTGFITPEDAGLDYYLQFKKLEVLDAINAQILSSPKARQTIAVYSQQGFQALALNVVQNTGSVGEKHLETYYAYFNDKGFTGISKTPPQANVIQLNREFTESEVITMLKNPVLIRLTIEAG